MEVCCFQNSLNKERGYELLLLSELFAVALFSSPAILIYF